MKKGYAGFATIGKADFSLAKRKAPKNKVFRPLRRARRATRPPPRRLLKKAGENFQQTDETRLFCLQSVGEGRTKVPPPPANEKTILFLKKT